MKIIDRLLIIIFEKIYNHFKKTQHITDYELRFTDILIRRIKDRTRF